MRPCLLLATKRDTQDGQFVEKREGKSERSKEVTKERRGEERKIVRQIERNMSKSTLELTALIDKSPTYLTYHGKLNNEPVMIKRPTCEDSVAKSGREVKILQDLGRKEDIVCLLEHFIDNTLPFSGETNKTYLCYQFMCRDLQNVLMASPAPELDIDALLISMATCLSYVHEKGYMHRDIKSANIFLDQTGKAQLGGFDLACKYSNSEELTPETGTYRWMAPEIIRHEPYDNSADVYSFGILMFECYVKEIPYSSMNAVVAAYTVAKENLRPTIRIDLNPRKKAIMKRCWLDDAASRPSFEDLICLLKSV